ncbi:MAG: hypothetical protein K1X35_07715 [Caulobacteraceae bacterium]|nr:hypothetical protein [Caulobacteraceae bacterium]
MPGEAPARGKLDLATHDGEVRVHVSCVFPAPIRAMSAIRPAVQVILGQRERFDNWDNLALIAAGAVCIVFRNRWVNLGVLAVLLLWMMSAISGYQLAPGGVRH